MIAFDRPDRACCDPNDWSDAVTNGFPHFAFDAAFVSRARQATLPEFGGGLATERSSVEDFWFWDLLSI
jgi:hypothetical protein